MAQRFGDGNAQVRPEPNGSASVVGVAPELTLRAHPHLHDDLLVGLATSLSAPPGIDVVSAEPTALRGNVKALLGGRASQRVIIAGELGFRFDNNDALVDDPASTVRLRAYGYRSQNRDIVITDGSVTLLNVELRKK